MVRWEGEDERRGDVEGKKEGDMLWMNGEV